MFDIKVAIKHTAQILSEIYRECSKQLNSILFEILVIHEVNWLPSMYVSVCVLVHLVLESTLIKIY